MRIAVVGGRAAARLVRAVHIHARMKHVGVALLVATACIASAATASADEAKKPKQTQPQKQTKKQKKAQPAETEQSRQKAQQGVAEEAQRAVDEANRKASADAAQANTAVVGKKTESDNERRARDPNLRPKPGGSKDTAEAVGRTTTTAAEVVGKAVEDTTRATDKPGSYAPFSLEWNPLGLIIGGRVSIQGLWAPTTHHVVVINPHFIHTSADIALTVDPTTKSTQTYTGVGGELGYRYYTGHRGMNGVFIGPSLIGGVYNASLPGSDQVFTDWGFAADVGLQEIIGDHFTIGGGVGLEYLHASHDFGDLPAGPSAIAKTGVKPRLLFSGGYAF